MAWFSDSAGSLWSWDASLRYGWLPAGSRKTGRIAQRGAAGTGELQSSLWRAPRRWGQQGRDSTRPLWKHCRYHQKFSKVWWIVWAGKYVKNHKALSERNIFFKKEICRSSKEYLTLTKHWAKYPFEAILQSSIAFCFWGLPSGITNVNWVLELLYKALRWCKILHWGNSVACLSKWEKWFTAEYSIVALQRPKTEYCFAYLNVECSWIFTTYYSPKVAVCCFTWAWHGKSMEKGFVFGFVLKKGAVSEI